MTRLMRIRPIRAALLLVATLSRLAAEEGPRVVLAPFCDTPPVLDGKLDDACWRQAESEDGFARLLAEAKQPTHGTQFRVAYDKTSVYVSIECARDPSREVTAVHTERDSAVFDDDCLELFLDTKFDRTTYVHLAFNSRGVQYDAEGYNRAWDGSWRVECRVASATWMAEVALPFETVQSTPESGQLWGLNVCRNTWIGPDRELTAWSDTGTTFHAPHRFGQLVFGSLLEAMRRFSSRQATKLREQVRHTQPLLDQAVGTPAGTHSVQDLVRRADELRASLDSERSMSRLEWKKVWAELEGAERQLELEVWDVKMSLLAALARKGSTGRVRQ